MPVLLFTHVSTSTSLCACIWYEHHYRFCVLQFKLNQLSSNKSCHTSCIHKGLHVGKWPDLMTSIPDTVSTPGYHWADYTGTTLVDAITQLCPSGNLMLICIIGTHCKPLEPQLHWGVIGTTLADASTQWYPNGNAMLICIIGTHWKPLEPQLHWGVIGTTLADASTQWYPSGNPVSICIIGAHWKTTWRPLETHWKHTGYQKF